MSVQGVVLGLACFRVQVEGQGLDQGSRGQHTDIAGSGLGFWVQVVGQDLVQVLGGKRTDTAGTGVFDNFLILGEIKRRQKGQGLDEGLDEGLGGQRTDIAGGGFCDNFFVLGKIKRCQKAQGSQCKRYYRRTWPIVEP